MKSGPELRIDIAINFLYLIHKIQNCGGWIVSPLILLMKVVYRFYTLFLLGIDLPTSTKIGKNLKIYHGFGLVISSKAKIGDNVILRQNTTIGIVEDSDFGPTIGNNVNVGANVSIIGDIYIGDGVKIGAGSVVVENVVTGTTVFGNPAKPKN